MERRGERNLVTSAGSFGDWSTVTHSHFATHLFTHSWIQQLTLPVMLLISSSSFYSFMNSAAFFPIFHHPLTKLLIMHWLFTYPSTYSVHFKVSNSITRILPCPLLGHLLVSFPVLYSVTYRSLTGHLLVTYSYLPYPLLGHLFVLTLSLPGHLLFYQLKYRDLIPVATNFFPLIFFASTFLKFYFIF